MNENPVTQPESDEILNDLKVAIEKHFPGFEAHYVFLENGEKKRAEDK